MLVVGRRRFGVCTVHQRGWFVLVKESEEDSCASCSFARGRLVRLDGSSRPVSCGGEVLGAWLALAGDAGV